ncbi:hypothetical protein ACWEP4_36455 [Streptomyces sp. NPDC004227]
MFDRATDVFIVALVGPACAWSGWRAVLRPRQPPDYVMIQGPVWAVRAWGLGFVVLGICLPIESVTRMAGGEPGWPAAVIRWVAGPLVVGSFLAALLSRRWERRRARAMNEGRQA